MSNKKTVQSDGESSGSGHNQKASDVGVRLRASAYGDTVENLDPEQCPKTMVPMACASDTRVGCISGRVYTFAKDKVNFVHKDDRDLCAGRGAVVQDKVAIEARKQAIADTKELEELRAEKAKRVAAAKAEEAEAEAAAEAAKLEPKEVVKVETKAETKTKAVAK